MWFIYNILFAIGFVIMLPKFIFRMLRRGGYGRNFSNRFAIYSAETIARIRSRPRIWIHAVSVGELYVALAFISEMKSVIPGSSFVVTTNTSTGYKLAEEKLDKDDVLLYFPMDFPLIVRKALNVIAPKAVLLTECELWPNLVRMTHSKGIPVFIINGRISDRSFRGYKLIRPLVSRLLQKIKLMIVQSASDATKLTLLGAGKEQIAVVGSVKYDMTKINKANIESVQKLFRKIGYAENDTILLGGSTWSGEEKALLKIYSRLREGRNLRLVLVPRHAERRNEVGEQINGAGMTCLKKSDYDKDNDVRVDKTPDVLLVDTTGELKDFYAAASIVFVGKSLCETGGQNFIEPAFFGKPIIVGPHLENFPVISEDFISSKAMMQVSDEHGLSQAIQAFASDTKLASEYGARAKALVEQKRGALEQSVKLISRQISM